MKRTKAAIQAQDIDFSAIEWSALDKDRAEFIYREAIVFHNKVVENLNGLNAKAYYLLSGSLLCLSGCLGFLISATDHVWNVPFILAASGMLAAVILLGLAIAPRNIYGAPAREPRQHFTGCFYKQDLLGFYATSIMLIHEYIKHNENIALARGRFLMAGTCAFIATVIVIAAALTVSRFLN